MMVDEEMVDETGDEVAQAQAQVTTYLSEQADRGVMILCTAMEHGLVSPGTVQDEAKMRVLADCISSFLNALFEGVAAELEGEPDEA